MDYDTIFFKINHGKYYHYEGKHSPKQAVKPIKPAILSANVNDLDERQLSCIPKIRKNYEEQLEEYQKFVAGKTQLIKEFEADCAEAFGMKNHPKRNKLWAKAWEHGHASGLGDVLNWYSDLSDLLKD